MNEVGIDFGTTNSVAAVVSKGVVRPWRYHPPDGALMRTVLTFVPREGAKPEAIIGARADELGRRDSRVASFASWKRRLGDEQLQEVNVFGETKDLVHLTAIFLGKLAAPIASQGVVRAVMTVPANAPELQMQRMRLAAEAAKIEVLGWLKEPTAAAVAYGLHRGAVKEGEIILIVDLGGGTFDVSIVEYTPAFGFRVLTTNGVEKLGGDDWDLCLARAKAEEYSTQFAQEVFSTDEAGTWRYPQVVATLKAAAEWTKIQLSAKGEAMFDAQVVFGDKFIDLTEGVQPIVSRSEFEGLTSHLIEEVKRQVLASLQASGHEFTPESIHHVVLVGGPTRMPAVRSMVREVFGKPHVYDRIDPDEVVALGAARYAADLSEGKDTQVVQDVVGADIKLVHHDDQGNEHRRILFSRNDPLGGSVELNFRLRQKSARVQLMQSASDTRAVEKRIATVAIPKVAADRGKLRAEVTTSGEVRLYVWMADGQRDSDSCKRVETPSDVDLDAVSRSVEDYVDDTLGFSDSRQSRGSYNLGELAPELARYAEKSTKRPSRKKEENRRRGKDGRRKGR